MPVGLVMFVPQDKTLTAKMSAIDANGRYQPLAEPGNYLVRVQMSARPRGEPVPDGERARVNLPEVD